MGGMEPNPYQSPVIPKEGQGQKESESAIALLSEMRDMQRETLALARSNAALNRYAIYGVLSFILLAALCIIAFTGVGMARIWFGR